MQITTEDKKETYEEKSSIGQTIQQSVFEKHLMKLPTDLKCSCW